MNPTPEQAHGWIGVFTRLGKTKMGSGIIGGLVVFGVGVLLYFLVVKDLKEQLKEAQALNAKTPEMIREAVAKERESCRTEQRAYFDLYMQQHNSMLQNSSNQSQIEEIRKLTKQNEDLLNELKNYK